MAKKGVDYLRSWQKQLFEYCVGPSVKEACRGASLLGIVAVGIELGTWDLDDIILRQPRIGRDGVQVTTDKLYTIRKDIKQQVGNVGAHNPNATRVGQVLRSLGWDEVLQGAKLSMGHIHKPDVVNAVGGYREEEEKDVKAEMQLLDTPEMLPFKSLIERGRKESAPSLLSASAELGHYKLPQDMALARERVCVRKLELEANYYNPSHPDAASLKTDSRIFAFAIPKILFSAFKEVPEHIVNPKDDSLYERAEQLSDIIESLA